jgi:hypothetical protein
MSKMRATQSFACGHNGGDRMITGGMEFDADDPIVEAFPDYFEEVPDLQASRLARALGPKRRPRGTADA